MDIKLCVFPTSKYPSLIAYTNTYKVRTRYANHFRVLMGNYHKISDEDYPYSIKINNDIRFLPYIDGCAFESLLNYYSHRETEGTIYEN